MIERHLGDGAAATVDASSEAETVESDWDDTVDARVAVEYQRGVHAGVLRIHPLHKRKEYRKPTEKFAQRRMDSRASVVGWCRGATRTERGYRGYAAPVPTVWFMLLAESPREAYAIRRRFRTRSTSRSPTPWTTTPSTSACQRSASTAKAATPSPTPPPSAAKQLPRVAGTPGRCWSSPTQVRRGYGLGSLKYALSCWGTTESAVTISPKRTLGSECTPC